MKCSDCGEERMTVKGMHWHLRVEHDYRPDEAYDLAGHAFEEEAAWGFKDTRGKPMHPDDLRN